MARLNIGEVEAVAGRTIDYDWEAYEGDGRTPIAIAVDDTVRFKLCATENGTPTLDLTSTAATVAGSRVTITTLGVAGTIPASGTVRLAQADTAALTGKKYWELILVDNSETAPADAAKPICYGTMVFKVTQGGPITL